MKSSRVQNSSIMSLCSFGDNRRKRSLKSFFKATTVPAITYVASGQIFQSSYSHYSRRDTMCHNPAVVLQRATSHRAVSASQERRISHPATPARYQDRSAQRSGAPAAQRQLAGSGHSRTLVAPREASALQITSLPVFPLGVTTADMKNLAFLSLALLALFIAGCDDSPRSIKVEPHYTFLTGNNGIIVYRGDVGTGTLDYCIPLKSPEWHAVKEMSTDERINSLIGK